MNWIDLIGWTGSALVIAAYALITYNKISASSIVYASFNLFGSLFLIINTVYYHAMPSAFVNVIWLGIAAWALVRILNKRKR